jgi:hypothetical protein
MTLAGFSKIERLLDRLAPALLLSLGLTVTVAVVAIGG